MNFEKISTMFREHAKDLLRIKDNSSRFRANSYNRVAEIIESQCELRNKPTKDKINSLPITDYMKQKILSILAGKKIKTESKKSDTSRKISAESKNKENQVNLQLKKELVNLMGIGEERANLLIEKGLTDINQLYKKKWEKFLPKETLLFLKLKPVDKIPHENIIKVESILKHMQSRTLKFKFVGSYRRKKSVSSDIDIMIISKNLNILHIFADLLRKKLHGQSHVYSIGQDKLSVVVDFSDALNIPHAVYKIDAFRVEPENEIPMLLYSTGSQSFNIRMRGIAKKKGMLLNQNGLFKNEKNSAKKIEGLKSEKDYFNILNMKYLEPEERI